MALKIKGWHIIGVIFTIILGTLLHFTYEWSGKNVLVSGFSAINESTWEHLKLIFFPMLIFSIFEYFAYGKQLSNYVPVKVLSLIIGMIAIVVIFYTYSGIFGKNYLVADIATFFISTLIAYFFSYKQLQMKNFSSSYEKQIFTVVIILLILFFIVFTFYPPHLEIFKSS